MLDHLIIATDPYFGQDILQNAAGGAQLVQAGFNELWQETLNGNLYGAMCKVGQFFALATLTLYMVELGKNFINQEDMKALSSWIWPIIVIGLLANNGTLLRSGTLTVRGYINNINNDVLNFTAAGANLEVAFNRAVGNIALQQQVGGAMERCRSIPGGTQDAIACLQQAELEIKKSAPGLFKGEAPSEGSWEFNPLKSLSDAKDALSNLSPAQVIEKVGNTITSTIGSMITGFVAVILLALNNAYQWGIEFTMLLTALLGPLAVGGSLLPFGAKPIFAWLTGYFSVGIAKLCFNIIIGLCGQLIANSEQNQPMIFLLFVGLVSPILASSLAAGGGLAVWSGLGKAASFGSQVAIALVSVDSGFNITAEVIAILKDGTEYPISPGAISILGKGNNPLIARPYKDKGGEIALFDTTLGTIAGLAKVGEIINRQDQTTEDLPFGGSRTRTTGNNRDITGAFLEGAFGKLSETITSRTQQATSEITSRPNIWYVPAYTKISILVNRSIKL